MTTELKPGWRWENFEQLRSTVVTAPNGQEYELRAGDITHPRAQRLLDAMFAALTQRPAAQEVDWPISASLGDIVALWDQHAPSEYMTAIHMQAKRALAGQQPMSPDMARWCAYVGGMVAHWVKSEPDALARLGDDAFEAAIAGIIERRLWAMPKPAPQQATPSRFGSPDLQALIVQHATQQATPEPLIVKGAMAGMVDAQVRDLWPTKGATPEPVGEAIIGRWLYEKWWAEYGKLADVDKPYYTFDELPEKQRAAYESLALMLTRPAPGVPEGFDSASLTGNHVTLCFESRDAALVWLARLYDAYHALAAQAKGAGHE